MKVPNIEVVSGSPFIVEVPLLALAVSVEDVRDSLSVLQSAMRQFYGLDISTMRGEAFSGKPGERLVLTPVAVTRGVCPRRILLVGLGPEDDITVEKFRRAGGHAGQYAKENKISQVSCFLPPRRGFSSLYPNVDCTQAYVEGVALALYEYQHGKKEYAPASLIELFFPDTLFTAEVLTETVALISAKYLARDLGNTPANLLTPTVFAEKAEVLADSLGFTHRVLGLSAIKSRRMGLLLSVSRGSRETPVFFHAWYTPEREDSDTELLPKVVLIGKGVTFDAGGTSLKPGLKMDEMKYDMCGGAAVIASMITVAQMQPNCEVHLVVPMTENLPDGNATKPGDVVTAMDGQTVEVLNTDAEGRLILADAFCYVKEHIKPDGPGDIVLDFATLTGAVIIALGHYKTGFYSNNEELAQAILETEAVSGEALWRMPLVEEMEDELKSDFADMANIGNSQTGGSIMGSLFLKKFIGEKWNWAHIDIAGTAWLKGKSALSYQPSGATGVMVGTIAAILKTFK